MTLFSLPSGSLGTEFHYTFISLTSGVGRRTEKKSRAEKRAKKRAEKKARRTEARFTASQRREAEKRKTGEEKRKTRNLCEQLISIN